jgi:perosamine synthetase
LRRLRNQGRDAGAGWLDHIEVGYNYRLSDIACALGRVQLERLDEILEARARAASSYNDLLIDLPGIELPPLDVKNRTLSWFVYVVRLPIGVDRERVVSVLNASGIATGRYFPPIHRQPAWRSRNCSQVSLPITEAVSERCLALPFFTRITREQQKLVATALIAAIA